MRISSLGVTRNWKRSLGELLLIVVGVLLALGANSWWEGRKDRARERVYLEQLLADMRENERRLRQAIEGNQEIRDAVQGFVDVAFVDGPVISSDSLRGLMRMDFSRFEPLTGSYTGLLQGGDLQLLRNDILRHEILTYAAAMEGTREVLRDISPLVWQYGERKVFADLRHSGPGVSPEDWREAMLDDQQLVGAMVIWQEIVRNRIQGLRRLEQPTRALRCLLEAELAPVEAVELEPASASTEIGESTRLEANVRFSTGLVLERCRVAWTSDDDDVAVVDDGVVTGVDQGDARITAAFDGVSGSAPVSVESKSE